jgi:hypothetical protein
MNMLSIQDICQSTGKSEKTIYRLMNDGKLPYKTIGNKRYCTQEDVSANFKVNPKSNVEMELSNKLETLTKEVARLSNMIELLFNNLQKEGDNQRLSNVSQGQSKSLIEATNRTTPPPSSSSNEIRAEQSKRKLFSALDKLKESHSLPMYRGRPSITGLYRITGIDRGTISKYIEEWIINNQT